MRAVTFTLALQRHKLFYELPGCEESSLCTALQASEPSCFHQSQDFSKLDRRQLRAPVAHPFNLQGPSIECKIFPREQNLKHSPTIRKPQADEELPLCGGFCQSPTPRLVSGEGGSGVFQGSHSGGLGCSVPQSPLLPREMLGFALLACSSSGPSVLCPQGSQTPSPIQPNPGKTEDCRSWRELEERFFGRE